MSGFGVGDAADLAWGVSGLLGYRLSERMTLGFGYRFYDIDYDKDKLDAHIQYHGPIVGMAFHF
jgi:opacity protein-like surface antigen